MLIALILYYILIHIRIGNRRVAYLLITITTQSYLLCNFSWYKNIDKWFVLFGVIKFFHFSRIRVCRYSFATVTLITLVLHHILL